jgi:formylmethanofuran dehydrogenase subunit E
MKFFLFFLLLVILLSFTANAEEVKCHFCGQVITGDYYVFESGLIVCKKCYQTSPKCALCGLPMKEFRTVGSKKVCLQCYDKAVVCDLCGELILGEYKIFASDRKVCSNCLSLPHKCVGCGIPLKEYHDVYGQKVCDYCYHERDKCYTCEEPILGHLLVYDNDQSKKYCQHCVEVYHHCAVCGAPVGRDSVVLDDDRIICKDCLARGYYKLEDVTPFKEMVLRFMDENLGMTVKHRVKYLLVGKDRLKEENKQGSEDQSGLFVRRNEDFKVLILYGLRQGEIFQVLPHEIAHAWQAENCGFDLEAIDLEGFAEWVSYKFLDNVKFEYKREVMLKREDVYGKGLRKMLEIEKRGGQQAVFQCMTTAGKR